MDVVILGGLATALTLTARGHDYPFLRAHAWAIPVFLALGCLLAAITGPTRNPMGMRLSFRANAIAWGATAVLCLGIAAFMVIRRGI